MQRVISDLTAKRGGSPSPSTESAFLLYTFKFCQFFSLSLELQNLVMQSKVSLDQALAKEKTAVVSPDVIMEERKKHWQSSDDDIRLTHEQIVKRFMIALSQEKVRGGKLSSTGKVSYALTAVRALYNAHYRSLMNIPTPGSVPEITYKVPTREELLKVVELAEPKLRSWILCDKDSGMSPIDLLNLTGNEESSRFGTIKEQLRKGICPIHVYIIRQKTKRSGLGFYSTFFGEEAIVGLEEWLGRRRYQRIFDIAERTLEWSFQNLCEKLGWKNFVPKSCRKFFDSELKFAKVDPDIVKWMMGHSVKKAEVAYIIERLRDHPEEHAKLYQDNYNVLRIGWKG